MIITIDGPAGTGKSTVAKRLAKILGFSFFDTGALYRALAWLALKEGVEFEENASLKSLLERFDFRVEEGTDRKYFLGNEDITLAIRSREISEAASKISALKMVREALLSFQRSYGNTHHSVFEGRDLGTVVFPLAEGKVFLTADLQVRAKRRYEELLLKDPSLQLSQVLEEMQRRDAKDSSRDVAPLRCPEGAFVLDTSSLSLDQVVASIVQYLQLHKGIVPCKDG